MEKSLQTSDECLILLAVKDRDLIGANQLMGESFLDFRRIARGPADESIDMADLDQIILPLTKPTDQGIFDRFVNLDVHLYRNCKIHFRIGIFERAGGTDVGQGGQGFRQERTQTRRQKQMNDEKNEMRL